MEIINKVYKSVSDSYRDLKQIRVLCCLSMLVALGIVLDFTSGIYITPEIKITFSFLAIAVAGSLLGPVPAMICGALIDLLMYLIKPVGAFFPGYTLSAILSGLIFGIILYRQQGKKVIFLAPLAKLLVNIFINILLNTCWLKIFTGKAYTVLLGARIIKNIAAWPVESVILVFIVMFISKNRHRLIK